ncbi:hypothetical protein [Shewanella surugensis]|uniref:Uncharacterized protein n=1 Tax=Shewanella surugensis TaxID=212020 RepID=A0ABT0LC67_9GAMM|nr:hypothetical protein [Shewanella surugensis]MCL1125291.1 hypothetical protein [Shewanella surugensis]
MDYLCGTDIQGFKIQFEKLLTQNLNDDEFDLAFEELKMMVNEENRSKVFAIQLQSSDIQLASGQGTVSYYINYIDQTGDSCNLGFERGPCSSIVDEANDQIVRNPIMSWYEAILSLDN